MKIKKFLPLLLALLVSSAYAQQQPSVRQSGSVTSGHATCWLGNNLIEDCGGTGGGTVTHVGATGDGILFSSTISGSPITTSGTLAFTPLSQTANFAYLAPNGTNGTPSFRALAAADLPVATAAANGALHVPINGGLNLVTGALSLSQPTVSVLGGILAQSGATSNSWVQYVDTTGAQHISQPNFSNLAGFASVGEGGTGLQTLGSPNYCLQVNSAGTALTYNTCSSSSPTQYIFIGTSASLTNPQLQADATTGIWSRAAGTLDLSSVGSTAVEVGTSKGMAIGTGYATVTAPPANGLIVQGNVGIGSNNPSTALSVGAAAFTVSSGGTVGAGLWNGTAIANQYGGTGLNTVGSTGVAQVSSGTWSISTALANGTTATAQSAGDTSTKVATMSNFTQGLNGSSAIWVSKATASNSATLNSGAIPAGYDKYEIVLDEVEAVSNGTILEMQVSENSCSTFISSANYNWNVITNDTSGGAPGGTGAASDTALHLGIAAGNGIGVSGIVNWFGLSGSFHKQMTYAISFLNNNNALYARGTGAGNYLGDTNAINCIQIFYSSGNISSGTMTVYAYRNS